VNCKQHILSPAKVREVCHSLVEHYITYVYLNLFRLRGGVPRLWNILRGGASNKSLGTSVILCQILLKKWPRTRMSLLWIWDNPRKSKTYNWVKESNGKNCYLTKHVVYLFRGGGLPWQCSAAICDHTAAGDGPYTAPYVSWGLPVFELYPAECTFQPNIDNSIRLPQCCWILWPVHQGIPSYQGMKAFLLITLYCPYFSLFHKFDVLAGLGQTGEPIQNAAEVVRAR
jgi:hypothetical protein